MSIENGTLIQPETIEVRLFDKDFEPTTELAKAIFRVTLYYDEQGNVTNTFRELSLTGFLNSPQLRA